MTDTTELIAYCGLYCGGCSFKVASSGGDMVVVGPVALCASPQKAGGSGDGAHGPATRGAPLRPVPPLRDGLRTGRPGLVCTVPSARRHGVRLAGMLS